ncbi:unnamed protein product [Schistosoma rodhaini]|uniref:Proteasome activator Blm10 mid region domain-containing protein n=1 Tax=Schistosoma rodhaini TaxID=6188 RepID=A0AA85G384_9TREM|nr:unnamed protein product [Schistosoma rodhaini]CAH8603930.1 unnamed protein product [Schistosoma rodhaini]
MKLIQSGSMYSRSDCLFPIHPHNLNKVIQDEWNIITQWLCDVLSSGDIMCEINPVFTTIQRFINIFGMRLSKTQRIALIHLTVAYICCPNIDTQVMFNASELLNKLLSNSYSLPSSTLSINWRNFFDMREWIDDQWKANFHLIQLSKTEFVKLQQITVLCSKFFPKSSVEEVWLEFRHHICSDILTGTPIRFLGHFLTYTPFYPKYFDEISRVWLTDIFDLWYMHPELGNFREIIRILCYVSRIGRGRIDWEPHMERIFTGLSRAITLNKKPVHKELLKIEDIEFYAELIMNTIGPDRSDCQSSVLCRLEQLLKSVESFYHPSSSQFEAGKLLCCFVLKFLRCLISRLRDELFPPVEASDLGYTPPEFYLSVEQVDQIVDLFTPICLDYFLYSKSDAVVNTTVKIIPMLCILRPSRVMPCLLDNLESGLSKLEMPLRFTRPLHALAYSIQSLIYVRFPLYPRGLSSSSSVYSVNEDPDKLEDGIDDEYFDNDDIDAEGDKEMREGNEDETVDDDDEGEEDDLLTSSSSSSSSDVDNDKCNESLKHHKPNNHSPNRTVNDTNGRLKMKKRIFQKSSYKPAYTHVSPSVRQSHLKAFTYLSGRAELNRVLQLLSHGLDMNYIDRFNYSVSCLSRIFLSTPIWDFSTMQLTNKNNTNPNHLTTERIISESNGIEDTVFMIYERIFTYLSILNDDSTNSVNLQSISHLSNTMYRPQTGPPNGHPRSYIDTCQMSRLTGLCVALSLSTSSNPQLRCRLIKSLVDRIFSCQWSPDTSRLIGYQAYWLTIDSSYDDNNNNINPSIYALKLIWPKFMAIVKEIENDGSYVYHYRAEPRLLSLLYILPGFICAIPPENLVDSTIYQEFIEPLIILLGKLCYLSTGCLVKPDWSHFTSLKDMNLTYNKLVNACPALSEASASFLAMLLHRLTSYSIDLRRFNLLDNIVSVDEQLQLNKADLYISSPWWSPFVNLKSIVNYCYNHKNRKHHSFWFKPTKMTTSLARQLVRTFLHPIMKDLERIHENLTSLLHTTTTNDQSSVNGINYIEQRNRFTSLTIWMNHLMNSLSDALAPRTKNLSVNEIRVGENFMPWHGLSNLIDPHEVYNVISIDDLQSSSVSDWDIAYFYMSSKNDVGEELREAALRIGLKLLDVISQLMKETDDNLIACHDRTNGDEIVDNVCDNMNGSFGDIGVSEKSNDCNSTTKSIWLLFNNVQIYNLIEFTHQALFNLPMEEHRPYLLQIIRGPQGLLSIDLGARNCLHLPEQQISRQTESEKLCIPSINSLIGTYCSTTTPTLLNQNESNENLQMYSGCTIITYIARIHHRFSILKLNHLRKHLMLTVKSSADKLISRSIACSTIIQPSLEIVKFTDILSVLATSPRRSDIRQLANFFLNAQSIKFVPSIGTRIVESLVNRLNNITSDIKFLMSSPHSSLCSSTSSVASSSQLSSCSIGSLERKQKLIHHRRMSTIIALKQIYARHHWNREYDELFRLNPLLFVQFCTSLIKQLINYQEEKSIWFKHFEITSDNNGDSMNKPYHHHYHHQQQHQLKLLQTNRDHLEHLIKRILHSFKELPIDFNVYLSFNCENNQIPSTSWLSKVYSEVNRCLDVFQCSFDVKTLKNSNIMNILFQNRSTAVALFNRNISDYIIRIHSNDYQQLNSLVNGSINPESTITDNSANNHNDGSSTSWSLTVALLEILRYPVSPPFVPVWRLDNRYIHPPILTPPSLKFIQIALKLMVSEQTEVAFTACRCISELIFSLIGFYRIPSRKCINPIQICQDKMITNTIDLSILPNHHHPNINSPIVAGPRPDNLWLLFNENAKILQSDKAYASHHHVESINCGFIYYPTHLYIYDPNVVLPYPTFDKSGHLITEKPLNQINSTNLTTTVTVSNGNPNNTASSKQSSWLSHFIIDDEENDNRQKAACLLAKKLCSPLSETREFWTSLAKQLLYMHRSHFNRQEYYTFTIHYLVRSCLLAFGPKNMLEHLEYFMKTLLITLPNSKLPLDGKAEFIGFYWIQVVLSDIVIVSSLWSRQWKYYFWGCFIPRILCWSEICALNVSVNDLAQSVDEKLHPAVRHVQWTIPNYAGRFAGGREDDDIADDINSNQNLCDKTLLSTNVKQSLAGGPFHRIYFMYDYIINCATIIHNLDVHCLHPLWDWAIQGLIDSYKNDNNNNNNNNNPQMNPSSFCQHTINKDHGITSIEDNCPSCILIQHLPLVHRRVFYERLCYKFAFSLGWIGIPLYKRLFIYQECYSTMNNSTLWYIQACNNSVWLRDLSASNAIYRLLTVNNLIYYNNKNNLNIIIYKLKQIELKCLSNQLSIKDTLNYQLFIRNLFQIDNPFELLGGEFLLKSFLPLLVRDTLNVLRLKRKKLSESSLMLSVAPPEQINSNIIQEIYKNMNTIEATTNNDTSNNNNVIHDNYRLAEIIVLSNRLYCLFSCLRVMLKYSCPTFIPSSSLLISEENSIEMNKHQYSFLSRTDICCLLAPMIADICSIGNSYDYFTTALNMKIFQNNSSLSKKQIYAKLDDDKNDGLICAISSYLIYLSALPLSGQGQSDVNNVLSFIEQFLQCFLQHTSWRTRVIGLLLLRNLVVFNLAAFYTPKCNLSTENASTTTSTALDSSVNKRLRSTLWKCLNDSLIEVSQVAMFVLAIFIEVGVIKYDKKWISQLMKQINRPLPNQTVMHINHNSDSTNNQPTNFSDNNNHNEYSIALRNRYASILALCSFVHGNPHKTPDYLPSIISELADHLHDSQPIKKIISSTLSSYSRTHQEVWHEQSLKFTPEQLDNYRFVISEASYYV